MITLRSLEKEEKLTVVVSEPYNGFKERVRKVSEIQKKFNRPKISYNNSVIAYQFEEITY